MNSVVKFMSSPKFLHPAMVFIGITIAVVASVVPQLKGAQETLYPIASGLVFWALKAPGRVNAQ